MNSLPELQNDADPARQIQLLISQHGSVVARVLRRFGVPEADVDDAAQRVFLTVARKLSEIQPGRERAFFSAIAAREASHVRRTYQRRRESPDTGIDTEMAESVRPDRLAVRKARASTLKRLLGTMQSDLRHVLLLVELEGHALSEAAEALQIPLGTCKSRLRRARTDLLGRIDALPDSVRALVRA